MKLGYHQRIIAQPDLRVCYGMEISRAYVDLIIRRWQTCTGKTATLEGDGRTFSDIEKSRG